MNRFFLIFALLFSAVCASAQISVDPRGVNVNSQNATTAALTFGPIPADYRPAEAIWCGELVTLSNGIGLQCRPDTIYGSLPIRYNRSQRRNINGNDFLFDLMAIPPSIVRRAYQSAVRGADAGFFYVRRFSSDAGNPDIFVNVTCRMTGGGARVPFSLTNVEIKTDDEKPVLFLESGADLPKIFYEITYNGTGTLKGRWELVKPGEEPPSDFDLMSEASIAVDERGKQKRYAEIARFNEFLPPSGKFLLPVPKKIPTIVEGQYQLLLRVEVSRDNESQNNLQILGVGNGIADNGAAANFPMPALKIFVSSMNDKLFWIKNGLILEDKSLPALQNPNPQDVNQTLQSQKQNVIFRWHELKEAQVYLVEFFDENEVPVLSAFSDASKPSYNPPAPLREKFRNKQIFWRVTALKKDGTQLAQTEKSRL